MFWKSFFLCCCVKIGRRFEDDVFVTVLEVDTDKWLRCRSGQVKIRIVLVIFVAQGMTINLEGPFFEPSVTQTIYETVPKKDKPQNSWHQLQIYDEQSIFNETFKKCTKSTSGLSQ